ncbi:MAG: Uma2 family endonuclease [Gammaproteobacteria bacterium]
MTVEDYLAAEEQSDIRHEYLGGLIYAMAGETTAHNQVVGNLYFHLRNHLKGGPCKLYMSDIRVNFDLKDDAYFYYPDLVVTCDPRDTHPRFVRHPKLLIEVLSPSTERVDRREKFFAYTSIASLEEYALVGRESREIMVARRANDWRKEIVADANTSVTFASLQLALPLAAIYEGV